VKVLKPAQMQSNPIVVDGTLYGRGQRNAGHL